MSRINGTGITLLGLRRSQQNPDEAIVTKWFTFLFLPILPLERLRVRLMHHPGAAGISYVKLEETLAVAPKPWEKQTATRATGDIRWGEVALTYLLGWVVVPAIIFLPLYVPLVFGLLFQVDLTANLKEIPQWLAIGWCVAMPLLAFWWHQRRYRPSAASR